MSPLNFDVNKSSRDSLRQNILASRRVEVTDFIVTDATYNESKHGIRSIIIKIKKKHNTIISVNFLEQLEKMKLVFFLLQFGQRSTVHLPAGCGSSYQGMGPGSRRHVRGREEKADDTT